MGNRLAVLLLDGREVRSRPRDFFIAHARRLVITRVSVTRSQ
jgi:hypothetical protein